jgi:hypothetical protein
MTNKGIHSSQRSFSASRPRRWASARPATPLGRGREEDALSGQAGPNPERDRDVPLAHSGAEQADVFLRLQEVELAHSERARIKLSGQKRDENGNEVVRLSNLGTQNLW